MQSIYWASWLLSASQGAHHFIEFFNRIRDLWEDLPRHNNLVKDGVCHSNRFWMADFLHSVIKLLK
jgi:ubiquinone biosynthesis protein COQ9